MAAIKTGAVNHLCLTVSDLARSEKFYTGWLGFQKVMDLGPTRVMISNGDAAIALATPYDPSQAIQNDRFNENRLGLDHLSFSVSTRQELEDAVRLFDAQGVSHGAIEDAGVYMLAFRDPDNIQLELTAPHD